MKSVFPSQTKIFFEFFFGEGFRHPHPPNVCPRQEQQTNELTHTHTQHGLSSKASQTRRRRRKRRKKSGKGFLGTTATMLRPPRSRRRYQGNSTATTNLSGYDHEVIARRKRRNRMIFGVSALLLVGLVIGITIPRKNRKNDESALDAKYAKHYIASGEEKRLESIRANTRMYRHKKSGLNVMTMVPDDATQDATFGINFRIIPENDRGIPKSVEHMVMLGSEGYPLLDPMNQIRRGSLQTHLSSTTEKDRSSFVFASRNLHDFTNTMKVMTDSIFHPLFTDEEHSYIFRQEGWRLELIDNVLLRLGGNALNEAKADTTLPMRNLEQYMYRTLFPDVPYAYNHRGDFRDIVSQTQAQCIDFYYKYYHPSNAQAFCYGPQKYVNACLDELHLAVQDFDHNSAIRKGSEIQWQEIIRVQKSEIESLPYPSQEDDFDFRTATTWVLNEEHMDDVVEVALHLLEDLLVGSHTAAISEKLFSMNVADDVFGGLDSTLQQWTFTLGVSGAHNSQAAARSRQAISDELVKIAENGFGEDIMKAALESLDLRFRDISSTTVPQGVVAFNKAIKKWNYDVDPHRAFQYGDAVQKLREEIDLHGEKFLLEVMTKMLIDNQHSTSVELYPSTNIAKVYIQEEKDWLNHLDDQITKAQGLALLRETNYMNEIISAGNDPDVLKKFPRLKTSDLNKTYPEIPLVVHDDIFDSGITMLEHRLPNSNGIAYVDFAVDISNMEFDDIILLPIFAKLISEGDTSRWTEKEFQAQINSYTGGIEVFPIVEEIVETDDKGGYLIPDGKHMVTKMVVRTSCVAEKGGVGMFGVIRHILFDADVQREQAAKKIIRRLIDDMEDDIQVNGHKYTTLRIESHYSLPAYIREQWYGVSQLMGLRKAQELAEINFDELLGKRLVHMLDMMTKGHKNGMIISATGDRQALKDIGYGMEIFLRDEVPIPPQTTPFPDFATKEHPWVTEGMHLLNSQVRSELPTEAFILPTRLNAVGKGGVLFDVGERRRGADAVVLSFLGGFYLYDELRYKNGASDAYAVLDEDSGILVFQTEGDPNITETLDIYEQASSWLFEAVDPLKSLSGEAAAAVVGAIGKMDGTAIQPSVAGLVSMIQYLKQDKPEYRQKFRDEVIAADKKTFMEMVDRLGGWGETTVAVTTNNAMRGMALISGLNLTACDVSGQTCQG